MDRNMLFDEETNFREICMGKIRPGILYRGSYPFFALDAERDAAYMQLVSDAGIDCIVNLSDNMANILRLSGLLPWYGKLVSENKVTALDIQFDFDFTNKKEYAAFKLKLLLGFKFMLQHKGPFLFHCNAGIDRTGIFAAIIEGLLGASLDAILYDYCLSYGKNFATQNNTMSRELQNFNFATPTDEIRSFVGRRPKNSKSHCKTNRVLQLALSYKNTAKIITDQIGFITGEKQIGEKNIQQCIQKYLIEDIGLSSIEVERLQYLLM